MTEADPAMERAQQRVKDLKDFYTHLVVYILVNTLLVVIDLLDNDAGDANTLLGLDWAYWPILGWGIGLTVHAFTVFFPFSGWEERKTQQLYEKEKARSRPGR
jgi:hypothetical protein